MSHQMLAADISGKKAFTSEVSTLTEVRHRNIVKLHGFCSTSKHSFLVYEYLEAGSVESILSDHRIVKRFGWLKRRNVVRCVAGALCYLHHDRSPPIVHRDISCKNILLDEDYEAHVSDFGTARFIKNDSSNWTSFAGTFGYAAPGIILQYCKENFYTWIAICSMKVNTSFLKSTNIFFLLQSLRTPWG